MRETVRPVAHARLPRLAFPTSYRPRHYSVEKLDADQGQHPRGFMPGNLGRWSGKSTLRCRPPRPRGSDLRQRVASPSVEAWPQYVPVRPRGFTPSGGDGIWRRRGQSPDATGTRRSRCQRTSASISVVRISVNLCQKSMNYRLKSSPVEFTE